MNKVYEIVTQKIVEQLEQGVVPWHKPWFGKNTCISHATGKEYSLINQMLLGDAGEYITFKQIQDAKGTLKKGSKAKVVVFWKMLKVTESKLLDDGETIEVTEKMVPVLRYYKVFNIKDTDLDPKYKTVNPDFEPIDEAEKIAGDYCKRENIKVRESEDRACYSPIKDEIQMPAQEQFESEAEYYATLYHEMIHSTGHKDRLNRLKADAYFGNEEYGKEELVAELGAAFMMNTLGIDGAFDNSASYIDAWLKTIKGNPQLIVNASAQAEKAVNYISGAEK